MPGSYGTSGSFDGRGYSGSSGYVIPSFFKRYKRIIIGIIVGVLLTALVIDFTTRGYPGYRLSLDKVKQLEKINDNLIKMNQLKEIQFDSLQKVINNQQGKILNNETVIDQNNKEINKLRRQYNEKIKSVDNLTPNGVDSFFTERYKAYY